MIDSEYRRISGAHAAHLAALLLRSSLTHSEWARSGPRRRPTFLDHLDTRSLAVFGINHLVSCPRNSTHLRRPCGTSAALPSAVLAHARGGRSLRSSAAPCGCTTWPPNLSPTSRAGH